MIAKELISNLIPPLKTSDTGKKARKWMHEFCVAHLPIVNNKQFLGLISEEDILDLSKPEEPLGNHQLSLTRPFVKSSTHIYDVMKLVATMNLTLVPVIDHDENYIGVIAMKDLIGRFAVMNSLAENGGILVLEMSANDYSLSEICRLIEVNDSKPLSVYITSHSDSTKLSVTIKVNTTELDHIVATFERFEYVVTSYQETSNIDDLKENFDSFMNYLNI